MGHVTVLLARRSYIYDLRSSKSCELLVIQKLCIQNSNEPRTSQGLPARQQHHIVQAGLQKSFTIRNMFGLFFYDVFLFDSQNLSLHNSVAHHYQKILSNKHNLY